MPYLEPSRPMPLSFMPPKGAISVEMMPSLMPTMPYSSDAPDAADVAAVEIGGEAEFGVVGHPDRLVLVLEAVERGDGAEGFLLGDDHVGCHIGQDGRLEEAAVLRGAFAAGDDLGALLQRIGHVRLDLLDRLHVKRPVHCGGPRSQARVYPHVYTLPTTKYAPSHRSQ